MSQSTDQEDEWINHVYQGKYLQTQLGKQNRCQLDLSWTTKFEEGSKNGQHLPP
jgi:hypothetical protein